MSCAFVVCVGCACIVDPGLAGYVVLLIPVWRALRALLSSGRWGPCPACLGWGGVL